MSPVVSVASPNYRLAGAHLRRPGDPAFWYGGGPRRGSRFAPLFKNNIPPSKKPVNKPPCGRLIALRPLRDLR